MFIYIICAYKFSKWVPNTYIGNCQSWQQKCCIWKDAGDEYDKTKINWQDDLPSPLPLPLSVWNSHATTILKCEKPSRRTAWKRVNDKIWLALLTIRMPSLNTSIIMNTTQTSLKARSETSLGHPNRTVQPLTPDATTPRFGKRLRSVHQSTRILDSTHTPQGSEDHTLWAIQRSTPTVHAATW